MRKCRGRDCGGDKVGRDESARELPAPTLTQCPEQPFQLQGITCAVEAALSGRRFDPRPSPSFCEASLKRVGSLAPASGGDIYA